MRSSCFRLPGGGEVFLAWAATASVPEDGAWLTPAEAAILARFRVSKRAADWRLGRWVAKEAVAQALQGEPGSRPSHPLARRQIEVLAGPGGGPRANVLAPGDWPAVSVSLSHSAGRGFSAAAARDIRLGCDVEEIAPRSEEFVSDYFTAEEAAWIRTGGEEGAPMAECHVRANLLWSAKESTLKALGEGLRKDTRSVTVELGESAESAGSAWQALTVAASTGEQFGGWWRVAEGLVWTVVA